MNTGETIRRKLTIDSNSQWFVTIWVELQGKLEEVRFKVDTGCNAVVLSHNTLKMMGFSVNNADLAKLPQETGRLASGEKSEFRSLGEISLHSNKNRTGHICDVAAICHSTRKTNDLLGTAVFKQFFGVDFNLKGEKYMELHK
jgi:predicted aspartyl protease